MWLPIIGLLIGILLGLMTEFRVPAEYTSYLSIAVLAALDTLFGGIRAYLQETFDSNVFVTGFFFNILISSRFGFSRCPSWCRLIFSGNLCFWRSLI